MGDPDGVPHFQKIRGRVNMDQIEQFQSTRLKLMKLQLQLNEQQEENLLTMVKILKASDNQRGGDQKEDAEESTDGEEKTKKAQQKKR